jgi:hypothetical protein
MPRPIPTTEDLHRQYFDSRLWAAGVTLRAAMESPLVVLGLTVAAMARRHPQQPTQTELFREDQTC